MLCMPQDTTHALYAERDLVRCQPHTRVGPRLAHRGMVEAIGHIRYVKLPIALKEGHVHWTHTFLSNFMHKHPWLVQTHLNVIH